MDAKSSKAAFETLLAEFGIALHQLTARDGFPLMLDFYRQQRADDCSLETDGDMLLYQWSTYDSGGGQSFEIDLTRQFILDDNAEDEAIWQLSLAFRFQLPDSLRHVGNGNEWCFRPDTDAVDDFEQIVRQSAAFQLTADLQPMDVELVYRNAG